MSARPAAAPTSRPAASLPVRLTAAIAGCAIRSATAEAGTSSTSKSPGGAPAAANTSAIASAQPQTFEACLSTTAFPAAIAGAAQRNTCQKGKFHGMTASRTPSASNRTKLRAGGVAAGAGASPASACPAAHSQTHAHFSTSPSA